MKGTTSVSAKRSPASYAMDMTMIAMTSGCASFANMLYPSLGGTVLGALVGAFLGYRFLRNAD